MNTQRLMDDIRASLGGGNATFRPNYCDATFALACNLVTNTISGELADHNLHLFLDKAFLVQLLKSTCKPNWLGHELPALLHGMIYLRSKGTPEERTTDLELFNACLHDFYRAALPIGPWDDALLRASKNERPALLDIMRPDVAQLDRTSGELDAWVRNHGFLEMPLIRSSLRADIVTQPGNPPVAVRSPHGMGYFAQPITASSVPQTSDLFYHGWEFDRWITIPRAMLIYKKANEGKRLHDRRWLQNSTTIAVKRDMLGPTGKVVLSLGLLAGAGDIELTVNAGSAEQKTYSYEQVNAITCELSVQRWVDSTRITVEATGNYVAQLETH